MKKAFYGLGLLILTTTSFAQPNTVCGALLKWQATRAITPTANNPIEYTVSINKILSGHRIQKTLTLSSTSDGSINQTSKCLLLDHLMQSTYAVTLEASCIYKLPNSDVSIKMPVLLIQHGAR
ncbi:MAG: hypothetical protein P1U40_03900 [Coxiellaceae bacterium]|nr:hypothetical protein [Coxiellaceae bacterium]